MFTWGVGREEFWKEGTKCWQNMKTRHQRKGWAVGPGWAKHEEARPPGHVSPAEGVQLRGGHKGNFKNRRGTQGRG